MIFHWIAAYFYLCTVANALSVGPSTVINRHSQGDIFSPIDCSAETCLAALGQLNDNSVRQTRFCQCQCSTDRPVYREDIRQCVNTIEECSLADYVSGIQSEKVPFVFLPAQGQLINPNAEIALSDVRAEGEIVVAPVCIVSKAHFLTRSGWTPTDNSSSAGLDVELPFALARESSRTHLQWLGESWLRSMMEGRIVLVKLLCKDTANTQVGVFSPCIAFRVAGSPGLVESIRSGPVPASGPSGSGSADDKSNKLRQADYLAIGISASLLGMLYVAGLVGYLCYRRRRRQLENVHVKLVSSPPPLGLLQPQSTDAAAAASSHDETDGIVPRPSSRSSQHYKVPMNRQHHRSTGPVHAATAIDSNRYCHQPEMEQRYQQQFQRHHHDSFDYYDQQQQAEAAAVAAAMMDDRRLFFSPAYFDPDLLRSPPPAALEFLARIRAMIDIAKDKMSSRRFMPSLIDIPEELAGSSAVYGSSNRLSRRCSSGSYQPHYGTIKRMTEQQQQQQPGPTDELYHPVELRVNFLQKSPLPGRKATSNPQSDQYMAAVYTNPSIEDIYKSLDRSLASTTMMKNKTPLSTEVEDSDAVSDLVSEAESKLPKITTRPKTYFEADSLDRNRGLTTFNTQQQQHPNTNSLYQKKAQRKIAAPVTTSFDTMTTITDSGSVAGGYNSSTCTSVQSLSRLLPAEEAMEVGNQLFNMDTGYPTLPKLGKPPSGRSASNKTAAHQVMEEEDSASSSGASSRVTVLTIQIEPPTAAAQLLEEDEENFEPDTLERRNSKKPPPPQLNRKHPHNSSNNYIDSLERPIQPIKSKIQQLNSKVAPVSPASTSSSSGVGSSLDGGGGPGSINREELPPPGSVISLRQIYTARKQPPAGGPQTLHKRPYRSLDSVVTLPPPLPSKSPAPPPIPRNLKPVGVHHHPSPPPPPPCLPPKNGKSGSSNSTPSADLGEFTLGRPKAKGGSSNVLERIARIELESSRSGSANKGMEIALALKAKMGHLEGSLKDHKKTSTIKKTWRKLLDRVEDSFSDGGAESSGSTLKRSKKKITAAVTAAPEEEDESDLIDDDDQSSLGSDGTGIAQGGETKLKSFYTFGEQQQPPATSATAAKKPEQKKTKKLYSSYQTCIGDY